MYQFVDPSSIGGRNSLLSLNTIFNGHNLDKDLTDESGRFVTLSVSGRGILSRRLKTKEIPNRNGLSEKGFTYDIRQIRVKFLIEDHTNEGFRERFNRLNGLLLGNKKKLEFTDENAYFIATLQSAELPEEDSNSLQGTLLFVSTDPAKRMNEKTLNITTVLTTYEITGQTETPWKSKTIFSTDANQFVLENNQGGKIILNYGFIAGDVLEIDYNSRRIWLNGERKDVGLSLNTVWFNLSPGLIELRASHRTDLSYEERYY